VDSEAVEVEAAEVEVEVADSRRPILA